MCRPYLPTLPFTPTKMITPDAFSHETYERFENQVTIAKNRISSDLGFDAWSVGLSDTQEAYGFLVPEEIYKKHDIRKNLEDYIIDIFTSYYIDVRASRWRKSSRAPYDDGYEYVDYCVNWCGSRHCCVDLKHHLLLVLSPGYWAPGRHEIYRREGACVPPALPYKWHVEENNAPPHHIRQWAVEDIV